MKIPVLGWTFAEDFLHAKTTHLAVVTLISALTALANHHVTPFQAAILVAGTLAAAFLRDSHTKTGDALADLIYEGLHLSTLPGEPVDGEVDPPQPLQPLNPTQLTPGSLAAPAPTPSAVP